MPAPAATKPARYLNVRLGGRLVLVFDGSPRASVYRVERLANDGPAAVLRWTKRQNGQTASENTVAVDEGAGYAACGCKGFAFGRGKDCRHISASRVLLGRGFYQEVD